MELFRNFFIITLIFFVNHLCGQKSTYVDKQGTFRYVNSNKEVKLFGINYTLPFAHGYRAINYLDKNHKEAIDKDVYHLARLDIDAYRVHIWDAEITDSLGNLIKTHQLDLLDYLLFKLKERGIKTLITPFKVGGNGYPERDFPAPGFSSKLGKWQTYSGKEILEKQKRYFTQLLNHTNPYTGLTYKNDPDIIALEINNEPRHDNGQIATSYINYMVDVIRKAGFQNPIFYNVSERPEFIDNYLKANIQGCTFQWYPTGLVHNSLLEGNYLPNVSDYKIPFETKKEFKNKARIIYEFDPGDTNSSTLFPAMARSFREAGFQFVAQFAYDPIDLAFANTEYQTHYLNLAYTPSKAISLKIASAAFHEIPKDTSFGKFPLNNKFLNTIIDADNDLSVYNSEEKFFYSNSTNTYPSNIKKLSEIAGIGSSSVVKYDGTGAYFLDKVEDGVWRLEVLPDLIWVNDPFEKASLKKTVAVLVENTNTVKINLPDLNSNFLIKGINKDNTFNTSAKDNQFQIKPGTYIIANKRQTDDFLNKKMNNFYVNEFASIKQNIDKIYLNHTPLEYLNSSENLTIKTTIVSPKAINKVEVVLPSGYQKTDNYLMSKKGNFEYQVTIPKEKIKNDNFSYYITVYTGKDTITYPDNIMGNPLDWDFVSKKMYETNIVINEPEIILFDTSEIHFDKFLWPRQWNAVKYKIEKLTYKDRSKNLLKIYSNNLDAKIPDLTFKVLINDIINSQKQNLQNVNSIVFQGSSGNKNQQKIQIALQLTNGQVFGKTIVLTPENKEHKIDFSDMKMVPMVLLPRPYPDFQPYFFQSIEKSNFDVTKIEMIQISIGPGVHQKDLKNEQEIIIDKITLK